MSKSPITCHVLDSSIGRPASGVAIRLQQLEVSTATDGLEIFHPLATGYTNSDGRCLDLLPSVGSEEEKTEKTALQAGQTYKIIFKTKEYFEQNNRTSFYPWVEVSQTYL
ncbi:hypothetical protein H0H81_012194 [Sphagnurus paluster]|uniref:Transthyretin/hydroxyisourate hydrolase domain-containing protein n=1 Tax=Sphagnurus paluster TaxID=117069 RepID=A0A9P7GNB5_9AGAR|nr:hypothetical protein H0H81_012194 [Sphagnurus paluster]